MKSIRLLLAITASTILLLVFSGRAEAFLQDRIRDRILQRFDANGDGVLDQQERETMRAGRWGRDSDSDESSTLNVEDADFYQPANRRWTPDHIDVKRDVNGREITVRISFPVEPDDGQSAQEPDNRRSELPAAPDRQTEREQRNREESSGNTRRRPENQPPAAQADTFPVIIFSHGAGGSADGYRPLVDHWVSHGYICLQPTHGDSISLLTAAEKREYRTLANFVRTGRMGQFLFERVEDANASLDMVEELDNLIPVPNEQIDRTRIGMSGHSYGAYTTQLIGGLKLRLPGNRGRLSSYANERPHALLMISPQGTGGLILENSWEEMNRPSMVITGSADDGFRRGQDSDWRMEAFDNLPPANKRLCFLEGATHSFGGISGPEYGEQNKDQVMVVNNSTLAFWDAELKQNQSAVQWLDSNRLKNASGGMAEIRRE